MVSHRVPLLPHNSESLGYRYFYSWRSFQGHHDGLFIPQGHGLSVIQHPTHWVSTYLLTIPDNNIRDRTDVHGYAILLFGLLLIALGLALANIWTAILPWERVLIACIPLVAIFMCNTGIASVITPDYWSVEVGLAVIACAWCMRNVRAQEPLPLSGFVLLGLFGGFCASIKPNLVGIVVIAGACSLRERQGVVRSIANVCVVASGMVAGLFLCMSCFYLFDLPALIEVLPTWVGFLRNSGTVEPDFWRDLYRGLVEWNTSHYSYGPLAFITLAACFIVMVRNNALAAHSRPWRLVAAAMFGMAFMHVFGLVKRSSGTTLWEMSLFCVAMSVLCLAMSPPSRLTRALSAAMVLVAFGVGSNAVAICAGVPSAKIAGDQSWALHEELTMTRGPVTVFIPDNRYIGGSIAEALIKGFGDDQSWTMHSARSVFRKVVPPNLSLVSGLDSVPQGTTLMWMDRDGEALLKDTHPILKAYVSRPGMKTQRRGMLWNRTAYICRPEVAR